MKNLVVVSMLGLFSTLSFGGQKILYFGDSQSHGTFGTLMARELEQSLSRCHGYNDGQTNEVHLYARSSSSPRHWGDSQYRSGMGAWLCEKTWKTYRSGEGVGSESGSKTCNAAKKKKVSLVQHLVEEVNPDKVVFQFLGNSMFYLENAWKLGTEEERQVYLDRHFLPKIQSMIDPIGSRECLFIVSNPNHISKESRNIWRFRLQEVIRNYLNAYYPNCEVIEGMTEETMQTIASDDSNFNNDKIHLSSQGARRFADYVSEQMCENAREERRYSIEESSYWAGYQTHECRASDE